MGFNGGVPLSEVGDELPFTATVRSQRRITIDPSVARALDIREGDVVYIKIRKVGVRIEPKDKAGA